MKKSLVSRILGIAVLYCAVFVILVALQFSRKGSFTLSSGAMTISGHYPQSPEKNTESGERSLSGGVKVFFGGLEFGLKEDGRKGLILAGAGNTVVPVNPDYMVLKENTAIFGLPDGTVLVFTSLDSARGPELRINATFADDASGVTIPFTLRRSSFAGDNGQPRILYNGDYYFFGRTDRDIENGKLVLTTENTFFSYRSGGKESGFVPADYVVTSARNPQDYEDALEKWRNQSFVYWNQNASSLRDEDDITAYCGEALQRNYYGTAVSLIPRDFLNSARRSYRSSGFLGGMTGAYQSFTAAEREETGRITRLIREGTLNFLKEDHIIDFLLTRNNTSLANDVLDMIAKVSPENIMLEDCPGFLEAYFDFVRWRLPSMNPVEPSIDQILLLISENIQYDTGKDLVFVLHNEEAEMKFNLRLGKALLDWAENAENDGWAAVGRSLILSALADGVGSGELYRILNPAGYNPRAASIGANGLWAWTVSPSVSAEYRNSDLNIEVSFPENMTHYMMIRGVRPFTRIQIHNTNYRSDSQFERYDSSGWMYYSQEQLLVLKLKHRVTMESVGVVYQVERAPEIVAENRAGEAGAP
ncbi:MAG: hypothetical protein LBG91_00045 [Treponema sp.]|jgi:hypothetical protein|nr:hypothetical protein [Treponema sp.]